MKHIFPFVLLVLVILMSSCGPSDQQLAQKKLDYAIELLDSNQFNKAKLVIDTLSSEFPGQKDMIEQGNKLLNRVELKEQMSSLAFYDSMLIVRKKDFNELKKNFVFKPGPGKGYVGTYVHKRQQVSNSYNRIFIKAIVDENGDFYIESKYHGNSFINHDAVKIYDEGIFAETLPVPKGINNRHFEDGEEKWESVNYKGEYDNGAALFIANNADRRLKAVYKGGKPYYIVLEKFDKEAVKNAYGLSEVITEMRQLETSIKTTEERIEELKKNI
jgi:hypothetical protein